MERRDEYISAQVIWLMLPFSLEILSDPAVANKMSDTKVCCKLPIVLSNEVTGLALQWQI